MNAIPDDLMINAPDEVRIRQDLVLTALGRRPADRALRVGKLLDVHTRTWSQDQEIVFKGRRIAWVGPAGSYPGEVLITPFTDSYARTKMRAWVLREACRWMRAPIPKDEERRLAVVRELGLLDSEPEERLDRITRLATALFDVPMATITFIDEHRQWFKSRHGIAARENPRDVSFCAHVVHLREPMVVSDALKDDRCADNPLVRGGPRIRFYAGYPLELDDGTCIGTLCLLDTRPRAMSEGQLDRLRDLASIAMDEIRAVGRRQSRV